MKKPNFFNQFLEQNREVGAIAPSSKFLVKKMLAPVDFSKAKIIAEFGPGTGTITEALLKKMKPDSRLIVFEINDEFIRHLSQIKDSRVVLINESAEKIIQEMKKLSVDKIEYVISSVPLVALPAQTANRIILAAYEALTDGGKYIQFQYSLTTQKKLRKIFREVGTDFTPFNLPPAFIYTCTK